MFNLDNKLYKNIFLVPVPYTFGVSAIYIFVFDYSFKQVEAMTKTCLTLMCHQKLCGVMTLHESDFPLLLIPVIVNQSK